MSTHTRSDHPFARWVNLAQPRIGAEVVQVSDEFFGPGERLIDPAEPVFIPGRYDDHGKWMDGWETRRRRGPGHDWCVVRLGVPGVVQGVDIDTRHFTGNFPPAASLEGCVCVDRVPGDDQTWERLLPSVVLGGDRHNFFAIDASGLFTHLRLRIFPDGGVARLRVFGETRPDWERLRREGPVDLAALVHGGRALACNDEHFGSMHNLIAPGRGADMGDGWETRRRREPGHDWVILALGRPGKVERVIVDTAHFKGNHPDRASIQGARLTDVAEEPLVAQSLFWETLLPEVGLEPDRENVFDDPVRAIGAVSHVRFNIHPDGGVSRLRLLGHPV